VGGCENGMLRRIFGRNKGETTGGWRRLHNEELRLFEEDGMCEACVMQGRDEK